MRILLSSDILKIAVGFVTQLYTYVSDINNYLLSWITSFSSSVLEAVQYLAYKISHQM